MTFSIEEEGQTALGGALLVSVELAKRAPGSKVQCCIIIIILCHCVCIGTQVILCTDGLANRGIGSLDGM